MGLESTTMTENMRRSACASNSIFSTTEDLQMGALVEKSAASSMNVSHLAYVRMTSPSWILEMAEAVMTWSAVIIFSAM